MASLDALFTARVGKDVNLVIDGQRYTMQPVQSTAITLSVNGESYTVDPVNDEELGVKATLNDFIRKRTPWTGTKRSCGEGGCGACVVAVSGLAESGMKSINSCLRPLLACNGLAVVTTEGIGNTQKGLHPIQKGCAENGGTQCGFCSPGFAMSMYGFLAERQGGSITKGDMEEALRGNICRCTGFRPILEASHKFATPTVQEQLELPTPSLPAKKPPLRVVAEEATWIDITSQAELVQTLQKFAKNPPRDLMLVSGRTSQGIWKNRTPDVMVNIGGLKDLHFQTVVSGGVRIGSGTTLNRVITFLEQQAKALGAAGANYQTLAQHLYKVASHPIRNAASVGGNIMLTHEHQSETDHFAYSDVTTILYGAGVMLYIVDPATSLAPQLVSMDDFYAMSMEFKYLHSILIPTTAPGEVFRTFRVTCRNAMSHAYVNCGLQCTLTDDHTISSARLVFGGIWLHPKRATATEAAMKGMKATDEQAFQKLCGILSDEITPTPQDGRVAYRKKVAVSLLYKFFLALQPSLPAPLASAKQPWFPRRPVSGTQSFSTDSGMAPVTKPEPKPAAYIQCSGEVKYTGDLVEPKGTVHLAPVRATALGKVSFDTSRAKAAPGFIEFFTHKDLFFLKNDAVFMPPLIATAETTFIDQVVGLVVADTASHAVECAKLIEVTYHDTKKPLVSLDEAIEKKSFFPALTLKKHITQGDVKKAFETSKVLEFRAYLPEQYHFHMETQTAVATPKPDGIGMHVQSSTQMPSVTQLEVAASVQGFTAVDVTVEVARCGGAYGGKIFNSFRPACYTAVVAKQLKKPVKMVFEIDDNMTAMGQRFPWRFDIKVGYESDGTITAVEAMCYEKAGAHDFDCLLSSAPGFVGSFDNCYNIKNWDVTVNLVKTDTPPGTAMRAPGYAPGIQMMEFVVSRVASATGLTPEAVREKNFYKVGDTTPHGGVLTGWGDMDLIWGQLKAQYEAKLAEVKAFNAGNRWIKKGVALSPVKYGMNWNTIGLSFVVAVNVRKDGSVSFATSGVEVGQGLLEKVQQVVAWQLGCPEELLRVQTNSTETVGDIGSITGSSITSELCCQAAIHTCSKINAALAPVRKLLPSGSWPDIVAKAYELGIKLSFKEGSNPTPHKIKPDQYNSYSAALIEVALDCLTGEVSQLSTNIVYDAGRSLNPLIDVGQVEGGYLLGMGYALTEELGRDPVTGERTATNTWEYHVPSAADIPQVWDVALLKGVVNPTGILGTKGTGEPPVLLGMAVNGAVEQAVAAFNNTGFTNTAFPFSTERRMLACDVTVDKMTFA